MANNSPGLSTPQAIPKSISKKCPCSFNKPGKPTWIKCSNTDCNVSWHASCAGFKKPKQTVLNEIGDNWVCPKCIIKGLPLERTSNDDIMDRITQEIGNLAGSKDDGKIQDELQKQQEDIINIKKNLLTFQEIFTMKFASLEKLLNTKSEIQTNVMDEKIKSYTQAVTDNIKENISKNEMIHTINEKISSVKTNLENNKETQKETIAKNNRMIHTINEKLSSVKTNLENNKETEKETIARKIRMKNVCLFNIPEGTSNDEESRFKEDISKLKDIFHGKLEKEDIKSIYRKGTYNKESKRPRPTIIKLNSMDKKTEILKIGKFKYEPPDTEDAEHINIYAHPDRTKKEQEIHKNLYEELNTRRENGESDIFIRSGKIVKILPFQGDPQSYWG